MVCQFVTGAALTAEEAFMISPVEGNRRVGLRRAVEFHKVTLENRLGLHGEIDQWKVCSGKKEEKKHG